MAPSAATAPQLRRFIKSRPYVPMHELRRRFAIEGGDDDVTPVHIDRHWIFVGLPAREGGLLGELLRAGEIGYELRDLKTGGHRIEHAAKLILCDGNIFRIWSLFWRRQNV